MHAKLEAIWHLHVSLVVAGQIPICDDGDQPIFFSAALNFLEPCFSLLMKPTYYD